ncbi:unnamed protein product [Adineta steineri]|uniref:Uncharacterized protein n=2 Tax=Adineta steineri TaxID=433720 RepID=A0A818RWB3_9BILA|nr:unnamed protein product [Adineta steineri]
MAECEHLRVGREFLESVSWSFAFRQEAHDRCYCERCYPPHLKDTMDVANYTYVIPRGWTRFAISVDEGFFNHHDVWDKWLNCYHGTSIENAKSCVEHRQLLLPNDTTMHGKKLEIREGHIKGEHYVFTTPSITYAALDYYAHTYHFQSPYNSQIYTIKVVLQCKQKPDSIIVQPETVDARRQGIKICSYIPNDKLEWKTQHRSTVTIYGLLLEVKQYHVHNHSNSFQYQQIRNTQNVSYEPATISQTPSSPPPFKTKVSTISNSENISSPTTEKTHREPMSKKRIALLILLVIATILPISALIFGQIYKNDCPIQPWIPRWMTIFGAVGLATFGLLFIILLITFKSCSDDINIGGCISGCVLCLLVFFFLGWLITGSVWVFPANSKVQYNQYNETNYCQENLYKFTFGLLLAQYSLIGLVICCGGILALLGLCLG